MWGANYVLRVYRDGNDTPVSTCGFWGLVTDDDVEALAWLTEQAAEWSPAHRLELQKEDDGWVQTLKAMAGCGRDV